MTGNINRKLEQQEERIVNLMELAKAEEESKEIYKRILGLSLVVNVLQLFVMTIV